MPKILTGKVVLLKTPKTASVVLERKFRHPLYRKVITRHKKYKVHYENIELHEGDMVMIKETRPISKDKHFVVIEKI